MPEYEVNDGGEKFTVEADSQSQASAAVANYQFMNFTGKLVLLIFLIVPVLLAKLVGIVFGLLGKVPVAGRIVQTFLVAFAGAFVFLICLAGIVSGIGNIQTINAIALFGGFAVAGYWYYLYHYHVVKYMGVMIFSDLLTRSFSIAFYGGILLGIIGGFVAKGETIGVFFGVLIAFIAAVIFYINKTKQFAAEAAEIRGPIPAKLKRILGLIVLGVIAAAAALGLLGDITSNIRYAADKKKEAAELTELISRNPSMAIVRLETPFEATVTSPIKGETQEMNRRNIEIPEGATITVTGFSHNMSYDANNINRYRANVNVTFERMPINVEANQFGSIKPK